MFSPIVIFVNPLQLLKADFSIISKLCGNVILDKYPQPEKAPSVNVFIPSSIFTLVKFGGNSANIKLNFLLFIFSIFSPI